MSNASQNVPMNSMLVYNKADETLQTMGNKYEKKLRNTVLSEEKILSGRVPAALGSRGYHRLFQLSPQINVRKKYLFLQE